MCNAEGDLREKVIGFIRFKLVQRSKETSDSIVLKIEKDINKELLAMENRRISVILYTRMRSTGWQPARFYELAKVYEEHCPLRPVLSLPGSSYYNLNKVLAMFFEKIQGANIETNSLEARGVLESNSLEPIKIAISLDVKSLDTKFPLEEAKDIALRKLFEQDEPPSIARKTMKRLLNMAVSQVISSEMKHGAFRKIVWQGGNSC